MIGSLRGTVLERDLNGSVLIEVGGVGYVVSVTQRALAELEPSTSAFLYVHHHIREDAQSLFGFLSRDERLTFQSLIAAHGEVSPEVAAAMATGARERAGASIGIGISGIAGPDGGTPDKPVGFVCFGIDDGRRVTSWSRRLPPLDRGFVRHRAAVEALAAVLRRLDER